MQRCGTIGVNWVGVGSDSLFKVSLWLTFSLFFLTFSWECWAFCFQIHLDDSVRAFIHHCFGLQQHSCSKAINCKVQGTSALWITWHCSRYLEKPQPAALLRKRIFVTEPRVTKRTPWEGDDDPPQSLWQAMPLMLGHRNELRGGWPKPEMVTAKLSKVQVDAVQCILDLQISAGTSIQNGSSDKPHSRFTQEIIRQNHSISYNIEHILLVKEDLLDSWELI